MSIQPDECIGLQFNAKVPGPVIAIWGVGMTFKYQDYFDAVPSMSRRMAVTLSSGDNGAWGPPISVLISSVDPSPGLGDGNEESIATLGFHRRLRARLINDARHAAKLGAAQS